ncbi:hypothetical protein ACO0R3_004044 [Hanseniaspora guilliermondii]
MLVSYLIKKYKGKNTKTDITTSESVCASTIEQDDLTELQKYYQGIKFYIIMFSLILILFVASLDTMIVITIITKVAQRFDNYAETSWLISGYSLPTAVTCLVTARFAHQYTVKSALILGVCLFEIGSLVSALSTSMNMLICGRAISGVGGSLIQNLVYVVVAQVTPPGSLSTWTAIVGLAFNVASVVGPIIGYAFTDLYSAGWRLCFYINLPVGGLAIVLFMFAFNHSNDNYINIVVDTPAKVVNFVRGLFYLQNWKRFLEVMFFTYDIVEFATCSTGFILIFISLTYGSSQKYSWNDYRTIIMLSFGSVLFVFSIIWDGILFKKITIRFGKQYTPLIDPLVFKKYGLFLVNMCTFLSVSGYIMTVLFLIQYYQLVLGNSTSEAGLKTVPVLVSSSITVVICSSYIKRTGRFKVIIVLSAILGTVGYGLLQLVGFNMHLNKIIGCTFLAGCGFGGQVQSTMLGSQYYVDKENDDQDVKDKQLINLTSFYSAVKLLAMASGSVISNTYFNTRVYRKVYKDTSLSYLHNKKVDDIIIYRLIEGGVKDSLGIIIKSAIKGVFYISLGFSIANVICSLFVTNHRCYYKHETKAQEKIDDLSNETESTV